MGWNDHYNWEMDSDITDLVDEGLLIEGTPAHGIALKVINEGFEQLSEGQLRTWEKYVGNPLAERKKALEIQRIIDSNPE